MAVVEFPYQYQEGDINPFDLPYVNQYRKAQWVHLISLPYGKQDPPPSGYTGRKGAIPSVEKYKEWIKESRAGIKACQAGDKKQGPLNIAIVHGPDTIAIDVDDYEYVDRKDGKTKRKNGAAQLKALEKKYGKLPTTWLSTARGEAGDYASGQRFFRLKPEHQGLGYNDKPGDSIEIVRHGHRYSVVWPSMNGRSGTRYTWYQKIMLMQNEHVWRVSDHAPNKKDLPYLPDKWVEFLTNGFQESKEVKKFSAGTFNDADIAEWIDDRSKNGIYDEDASIGEGVELPPCRKMATALETAQEELPEGAHDALTKNLYHAMSLAHEGHSGIRLFLQTFHDDFIEEVQGRRDGGVGEAEGEWFRSFRGAFERIAAREDPTGTSCPCFRGDQGGFAGIATEKDPADYDKSDDGNAEHLVDIAAGRMRWVPEWKAWAIWDNDSRIWVEDSDNVSVAYARFVGTNLQQRAKELQDYAKDAPEGPEREDLLDRAKKLWKWGTNSRNSNKITGMIRVARSYPNVTISSMEFDMDPTLLAVSNGTLEFSPKRVDGTNDGSVVLRETRMDDYATLCTNIEYVPWDQIRPNGSGAALMRAKSYIDDYLRVFLPDMDIRLYTQKVLGYGMYGANPERKIVFLHGKTSTGKSTITSAINGALGTYASTFNLSLLREKQDEGPRAEVVHVMGKRIIMASESGSEWHLHADMIKRLTGGSDAISARKLHSNNMIERIPAFTPFVACNGAPTIDAADAALWRRLLVIPFDQQVGIEGGVIGPEESIQKSGLDAFMASDIGCRMVWLSWLVEGYKMWANEGLSNMPNAIAKRTEEFKSGVSDLHMFIEEHFIITPETLGMAVSVRAAYSAYESWCMEKRIADRHKISMNVFVRRMKANGIEVFGKYAKKGDEGYIRGNRNPVQYLGNIQIRPVVDGGNFDAHNFNKQFEEND